MILKHSIEKHLLFDGAEQDLMNKPIILKTGFELGGTIGYEEIGRKNFELLGQEIIKPDFDYIVRTGNFILDEGFIKVYKGSDNLRLYYCERGKNIIVFAVGEYQPARYKLYLEGVWVLS